MKVAILIVSYNMPERTDALCDKITATVKTPHDLIVIDNGSDIAEKSKYTTLSMATNVQTTGGWLMGLHYADALARKSKEKYFAYWFFITSAELPDDTDPLTPMVEFMASDKDIVGVHPSLTQDSTTTWKQLYDKGTNAPRRTWMIDNIASLYRAEWFDGILRFDPKLRYAWGIDLETSYLARCENKSLWVDERVHVRKVTDIGYAMGRMNMQAEERRQLAGDNMRTELYQKYGPRYWEMMTQARVQDEWL
jgi:hypothetical protein